MYNNMKNRLAVLIVFATLAPLTAAIGCANKEMKPARAIPPGDQNTTLCKETYMGCRGNCASNKDKDTRLACGDLCERDVDTCLLQSPMRK
jgi:hypothetical protein